MKNLLIIVGVFLLLSFTNNERNYKFLLTEKEATIIISALDKDTSISHKDYKDIVTKIIIQFKDSTLNPKK